MQCSLFPSAVSRFLPHCRHKISFLALVFCHMLTHASFGILCFILGHFPGSLKTLTFQHSPAFQSPSACKALPTLLTPRLTDPRPLGHYERTCCFAPSLKKHHNTLDRILLHGPQTVRASDGPRTPVLSTPSDANCGSLSCPIMTSTSLSPP